MLAHRNLPEMEFDNWDPGILTGGVEFCNKPERSSKFAVNLVAKINTKLVEV